MSKSNAVQVDVLSYDKRPQRDAYDIEGNIYDINSQIDILSSQADSLDYLVSIGSGLLCGLLDILWVGDFDLARGRNIASQEVDKFVTKTAKLLGCESDDLGGAVKFLENKFPIPSDGNTPEFGGGLQHHLRDFAHHPTIVGLAFSLLTQFTYQSYGTDTNGLFKIVPVKDASKAFIGKDVPTKILFGTIVWFFHLVSDMAGSGSTAGLSGGTGIPGPLLALAKELSVLPFFKKIKVGDNSLSVFLSKLFNGTLLAKRDENNKIIKDTVLKFDLRGELGLAIEVGRQAIPVVANECIVRGFYFIRRLAIEIRDNKIKSLADMKKIDWDTVKPANNPTISRMLLIATGVFTTVDVGEAIISQKYWVSINFVGVGRFAVAIGEDISWHLKSRNLKQLKAMYETMDRFVYKKLDDNIYERIASGMDIDNFGLTVEQTELLYNLEYYKTLNDIENTKLLVNESSIKRLKQKWLKEWKNYISGGFSSFLKLEDKELHWYSKEELIEKIEENDPKQPWLRLVVLEAMLFEPYYPLKVEKNRKGVDVPSKEYQELNNPLFKNWKSEGDEFLEFFVAEQYIEKKYIKRLRKCYDNVLFEINEVLKGIIKALSITAVITAVTIATAGTFAGPIAVALVGSKFAGLGGAALTSACLAYFGGGAIAAGGLGMAGGVATIVGGGAILGIGLGAGIGGGVGSIGLLSKNAVILQSAKLLVSVREIFLNDEHDIEYSNCVYKKYVENIVEIEKSIVVLKSKASDLSGKAKKDMESKIKRVEESVKAMKVARKSLQKFKSSFEEGVSKI